MADRHEHDTFIADVAVRECRICHEIIDHPWKAEIDRLREELYTAHLELNSNGDDIICQCDDCEAYRAARTDISSPPATTFVANPFDLPESAASSGGDVHIDVSCGKVTPLPISLLKRLKAGEVLTYTHNDKWAVNGVEVDTSQPGEPTGDTRAP